MKKKKKRNPCAYIFKCVSKFERTWDTICDVNISNIVITIKCFSDITPGVAESLQNKVRAEIKR